MKKRLAYSILIMLTFVACCTFGVAGLSYADEADASNTAAADTEAKTASTETDTSAETNTPHTEVDPNNAVNPQLLPDSSFIYDVNIADLAHADSYYNGQTVQVVGEAVGDKIASENNSAFVWVTLQGSPEETDSSVFVYMTKSSAEVIDTLGDYQHTGTMLQVRGTFNLACSEHQGLSDLHASSVAVVSRGESTAQEFNAKKLVPGVVSVLIGLGILLAYRQSRERQN